MPVGRLPSPSPEVADLNERVDARGALTVASIGPISLSLSYSVPIGLVIVIIAVALGAFAPGTTTDWVPSAAAATGFWITGWLIQGVTYFGLAHGPGRSPTVIRVGILGVELSPRVWSARRALSVGFAIVMSILSLGMFYRWVEGDFRIPQWTLSEPLNLTPPGLGFKSHESVWATAAWLCWVQAVFQMIPFPRTSGRQMVASCVVLMSGSLPEPMQCRLFRRMIVVLSIVLMALTFPMMASDDPRSSFKWPWVLLAGVLLCASSRGRDIAPLIRGMQPADSGSSPSWSARFREFRLQRRGRKKLQRAIQREHDEAADVGRLDDILNRLHRDGVESLSKDDRRILDRVSENLRRQRDERR